VPGAKRRAVMATASKWLTRSVVAISFASLFSDACYESIIPLLPAFLASLGGGPAVLGLMEGLADGVALPLKLAGGRLADRTSHRRQWTAAGYLGVGLLMPAIALAQSVAGVVGLRAAAWMARGFRSPIKDTLLVDDTDPRYVNRAFGFQRAMDSVGAVIGPACAVAMIAAHWPVRSAILMGVIPGVLAATMYFFVRERPRTKPPRERFRLALAELPKEFNRYLIAAGIFGAGNFSATLLVLVATRALEPHVGAAAAVALATSMYLGHNVLNAAATYPASIASERVGVGRMLLISFALFSAVGAVLAFASTSIAFVIVAFALAALAAAILEPMEGTFATGLLPAQRRGTGFGALAAVNGVGDFISSAGVGVLWQALGPAAAFGSAAAICAAGTVLLVPLVFRKQ
jgi:MFS family permease